MPSKKKRKSSCPFASANRADVLATRVIQSICDFVGECFCKIRATFMLDRVLSKRGLPVEDCAFF